MKELIINAETIKENGISILTGEACALSMRLLCEVSPEMMELYLQYTGIRCDLATLPKSDYNNRNWYAVYLTREIIRDLLIMKMASSYEVVQEIKCNPAYDSRFIVTPFYYCGTLEEIQQELERDLYSKFEWNEATGQYDKIDRLYDIGRRYSFGQGVHRGFGNVHAFSGACL